MSISSPTSVFSPRPTPGRLGARWVATSRRALSLPDERRVLRRVRTVWWLLFFNVIGAGGSPVLHIPHRVGQVMTQGALLVAILLALSINPRARVRPNVYLSVFTVLGVTSLMASVRVLGIGTDYRALRILAFVAVLWLLTPWWGRRDLLLLRAQIGFLVMVLGSVVVGLFVAPGTALSGGRLGGSLWPIPPPQVAHYAAELTGLALLLWACRLVDKRVALLVALPCFGVLVLTHTRTALVAAALGIIVALASLFTMRRRVRRAFAGLILAVALVGVPLSPLIVGWLARGENSSQLATLTGRTTFWAYVFDEQRTDTQKILGDGISNGAINGQSFSNGVTNVDGLSIDNSWVEDYQDEGIIGDVLTGLMFVVLLVMISFAPRGPRKAIALFLVLYCLVASFTEDGAGLASQYAMDMTVAASLMVPGFQSQVARWRSSPRPRIGYRRADSLE
jgi:hypothetical protein